MAETGKRREAFGAFYFRVDLHAKGAAESYPFKSCSGLKSESTVVELEEGGFNTTTRKLIGRTKFPNIVLKQGFCGAASSLWHLRMRFLNDFPQEGGATGQGWHGPSRFNGTITQLDTMSGNVTRWARLSGPLGTPTLDVDGQAQLWQPMMSQPFVSARVALAWDRPGLPSMTLFTNDAPLAFGPFSTAAYHFTLSAPPPTAIGLPRTAIA